MTKKIYLLIAGLVIIILAAFSIYFFSNRNQTVAGVKENQNNAFKLGYTKTSANVGVFVAQERGYFKEQDLNIEFVEFQSANEMVNALVKGDIQTGCCAGITPAFDAYKASPDRIKLYSISDDSKQKPWNHLIVKDKSTIQNLKDLENKKVGVYPGSNASPNFKAYLKSKNVDDSKVELIQLPAANQLPSLESNSIDALWAYEPTTTIALNKRKYRIIDEAIFSKLNPKANMAAGYISPSFITNNPDQAKKFVLAMDKANTYAAKNPTETSKLLSKYTTIDPTLADKVQFVDFHTNAQSNPESLQATADFLAQIGVIKQKIQVNNLIYKP